ncbi:hypothetical protein D3C85_1137850 [compost metagenome]
MLNETIDFLHGISTARCNPFATIRIQQLRFTFLFGGHRLHNSFNTSHLLLVNLHIFHAFNLVRTRQHIKNLVKRTHLLHLLHLFNEILEGEFGVAHFALHLFRLVHIDTGLRLLN